MPVDTFIDTNVFVYHLDASDPRKHTIAGDLVRAALVDGNVCISTQVVQEWLNVATTKARVPLSTEDAMAYLDTVLMPLVAVAPSADLYRRALAVRARWGFGFCDALIVAAALAAGCARLLTEDLQDGQRIDSLTVVNPFR